MTPWQNSETPNNLFFDLENIAFSHLSCNSAAAKNPRKLPEGEANRRKNERWRDRWAAKSLEERREIRRNKYLKEKAKRMHQ